MQQVWREEAGKGCAIRWNRLPNIKLSLEVMSLQYFCFVSWRAGRTCHEKVQVCCKVFPASFVWPLWIQRGIGNQCFTFIYICHHLVKREFSFFCWTSLHEKNVALPKVGLNWALFFIFCFWFLQLISPHDVAVYGGLCALASFDRQELRTKVLSNR